MSSEQPRTEDDYMYVPKDEYERLVARAARPTAVEPEAPPWDHAYEGASDSMRCVTCGFVGSYAHTEEFYRKWVFPETMTRRLAVEPEAPLVHVPLQERIDALARALYTAGVARSDRDKDGLPRLIAEGVYANLRRVQRLDLVGFQNAAEWASERFAVEPDGLPLDVPDDKELEAFAKAIKGSCEIAGSHYVYPRHAAGVLKAAAEHGIRLARLTPTPAPPEARE